MSNESAQTLGQRIDAVLEPLYAEAEQHRETIAQVTVQQNAIQKKMDAAKQGLSQIESRMAEVVRAMAQQEPVIAAVVGDASAPVQTQGQSVAAAQPVEQAQPAEQKQEQTQQTPTVDPDPVADEAAALLDAPPAVAEPQVDLADAAERAATAAKMLRDQAETK